MSEAAREDVEAVLSDLCFIPMCTLRDRTLLPTNGHQEHLVSSASLVPGPESEFEERLSKLMA